MSPLNLTYSLADQSFDQTKSLGIFNISLGLLERLVRRPELGRLTVLTNHSLNGRWNLPSKVSFQQHDIAMGSKLRRMYWDQWGVYQAAAKAGNPWLFLPKGFASFLRPCPVRLAAWVADGMQDFYRQKYPDAVSVLESAYFWKSFRATLRYSRIIFTISDFTSSEVAGIARRFSWPTPRIQTIGVGFELPPLVPTKTTNSIVVLAGRFPHKRTDLALEYLERFQKQSGFSGQTHWVGTLPDEIRFPNHPGWQLHLRMPEADYRRLLAEARVLVYFSEYEGFGMPPVEAALLGTSPVYSDLPVTREVMGGLGFAFQNESYESFARAVDKALKISVEQVRSWGELLQKRHNWDQVAHRVVQGLISVDE